MVKILFDTLRHDTVEVENGPRRALHSSLLPIVFFKQIPVTVILTL